MNHKCASNNSNKSTQRKMALMSYRNAVIWLVGKVTNQIILQNFPDHLNEVNSHASSGEKCVEIVKTLHVKFFPFGSAEPVWSVTVKTFRFRWDLRWF